MSTPEREHQIQKIADQFQLINHATIKLATAVKDLRQNKVDFNNLRQPYEELKEAVNAFDLDEIEGKQPPKKRVRKQSGQLTLEELKASLKKEDISVSEQFYTQLCQYLNFIGTLLGLKKS